MQGRKILVANLLLFLLGVVGFGLLLTGAFFAPHFFNLPAVAVIALIGLISVIFIFIFSFVSLRSSLDYNLTQLQKRLQTLAAKDLTSPQDSIRAKNELLNLADELRKTLLETFASFKNSAAVVEASSHEFVTSSEELFKKTEEIGKAVEEIAGGAEDTAAGVNTITHNIEELSLRIDQVSQESAKAVLKGQDVQKEIERGKSQIALSVAEMNNIKERTDRLSKAVETLSQKSEEVMNIVQIISDIAGQTNLLALNAAIEAVQAGSEGRGFAVVADEIRKLAEESTAASKNIAELLQEIEREIKEAHQLMQDSNQAVAKGTSISQQTDEVFEEIKKAVDELLTKINTTSRSATEMRQFSGGVSQAVNEILAISEEFAATSEEVASLTSYEREESQKLLAASRYLIDLAADLSQKTKEFKLSKEETGGLVEWTEDLAVSNEEIDSQHQELFRRINAFMEACRRGEREKAIDETMSFLSEYVDFHFGTEERYMQGYSFKGYEKHKEQHDYFKGNVAKLMEDIKEKGVGPDTVIAANSIVVDWLIKHIKTFDPKLASFLKDAQQNPS
jgi:hemerythrin-like metal-binding protein